MFIFLVRNAIKVVTRLARISVRFLWPCNKSLYIQRTALSATDGCMHRTSLAATDGSLHRTTLSTTYYSLQRAVLRTEKLFLQRTALAQVDRYSRGCRRKACFQCRTHMHGTGNCSTAAVETIRQYLISRHGRGRCTYFFLKGRGRKNKLVLQHATVEGKGDEHVRAT